MEFLKDILGDELYKQVEAKINQHNGAEGNKEKQIKIGNLGAEEYVSKLKYSDLESQLTGKSKELDSANKLISELKKSTSDDEKLQTKIADYEAQVEDLQKELAEIKLKSAVKVALLSEGVLDVDYLTFKLNEKLKDKGEKLELDDNDNIKDWKAHFDGLKTQFPNMFKSEETGADVYKPYKPDRLPEGNRNRTVTKEQFRQMSYEERVKLKQENEKLYRQMRQE
ncbi:MAG: hypothetical protein HFE90_08980 [Firmicutes bacterium]|nr:hypothetical protein [Bacillota bacterium]